MADTVTTRYFLLEIGLCECRIENERIAFCKIGSFGVFCPASVIKTGVGVGINFCKGLYCDIDRIAGNAKPVFGILQSFILIINTVFFPDSLQGFCSLSLQIWIEFTGAKSKNAQYRYQ